jgi:LPS-assembly protein
VRRRRPSAFSLTLFLLCTIAPGGLHQHLQAQEVTSEAPPAFSSSSQDDLPDLSTIPHAVPFKPEASSEDVPVAESDTQSLRGDLFVLSGNVVLTYRDHIVRADRISYNRSTGEATLDGHVEVSGGENQEVIHATHGNYNFHTSTGRFYEVSGSVGMGGPAAKGAPATNPFLFAGRMVVETGPANYDVYDGWVTSCQLPDPDWKLSSHHLWLSDEKAHAASSTFHLLHMPILFLPYVTHPVDVKARQSGILIPVISQSSTKGFIIGDQVYLTLGRSADATAGFEYFSSRGFSEMGTVRYRGRGQDFALAHFSALQDRGYTDNFGNYVNQGGQDVTASFRRDFTSKLHGVGDAEYLSSYVYREAFNDNFNQAVSSDITSLTYLAYQSNGFSVDGRFDRYQGLKRVPYTNEAGVTVPGEDVRIFHAPSFDFDSIDHHIGKTPLLWDVTASFGGLKRVQPNFTNSGVMYRQDIRPEISLPLSGAGWHTMTSVAFRDTFYADSRVAPYGAGAVPIELHKSVNRTSVEMKVDVRPPAIERTFEVPARFQKYFGTEVRHTVEPELVYSNTRGINNFLSILRFDDIDLDSNTNELEYGVTQHLFFRPRPAKAQPACTAIPVAKPVAAAAQDEDSDSDADSDNDSILSSEGSGTDANGIPNITSTAADAPTRAHHKHDPCAQTAATPRQTEWFSWKLAQRHFFDSTFGGAVINERRNVFDTTLSLSGIAFLTEPRSISPLISRMRFRTSSHTDVEWDFDLDTGAKRLTSSNIFLNAHEGQWFGGFSYAGLNAPGRFYTEVIDTTNNNATLQSNANSDFSQMRLLLGYGSPTKPGLSMGANAGLDLHNSGLLQYGSFQASYNWNCCGLSVEYRKYELGSVRNEGVERFSFTLINIGTAGNLRRTERLF